MRSKAELWVQCRGVGGTITWHACPLRVAWRSLSLGPTAKQGGVDKLLWGHLEIRVQLCSSTLPQMFSASEEASVWRTLSPLPAAGF